MTRYILFLFPVLIVSCGLLTQTWEVSQRLRVSDIGRVGVMSFGGYNGDVFTDLIVSQLLIHGVDVIERAKIQYILEEHAYTEMDVIKGRANISEIGKFLGIDTLVFGSIVPITVYATGGISGKVSAASVRLVDVDDGRIVSSATFGTSSDLLAPAPTYFEVARRLIDMVLIDSG